MTDHKFTDEEIRKSMECCGVLQSCEGCPYYVRNIECGELAPRNAFDLINRQKAEIKSLNIKFKAARGAANYYKSRLEKKK